MSNTTGAARRSASIIVAAAAATALTSTVAPEASAATMSAKFAAQAKAVLAKAKSLKGRPYRYGGNGPRSFDCSGYTRYVVWHAVHKKLPRVAADQYRHAKHINQNRVLPGDLIFEIWGGRITHVGIYAGKHKMWHAPRTGDVVRLGGLPGRSHWKAARVLG